MPTFSKYPAAGMLRWTNTVTFSANCGIDLGRSRTKWKQESEG
jgi:hypothetical protein